MLNAEGRLAIAELVIYLFIFPVGVYLFCRHGKQGYVGWGFFLVFCALRLASSGLQIKDTTATGGIINSVGISALLLAISDIVHEASTYTLNHCPKIGWIIQLLLHILITTGIAMSAVASSNLQNARPDQISIYRKLQESGSLLLLLVVIFLAIMALMTLRKLHATNISSRPSSTEAAGTLTIGAFVALHFAAVRVIYSVVYAFTQSRSLSPITGTFAVKFILITLVQICASLALIAGGLSSRNIRNEGEVARRENNRTSNSSEAGKREERVELV